MIFRNITSSLTEALSDSPVVLLNGARQSGKSTLVKWLASGRHPARYLTLDDAAVLAAARHDPEGFISGLEGNIVIDEVQRAPELFVAIKSSVDSDRSSGRFLLTGSANVMLLPRLSESLAGRMEILTLWPMSQGEIISVKEGFIDAVFAHKLISVKESVIERSSLIKIIFKGGYPEVLKRASEARRNAWFGSYITTILQRDVRDLAHIEGLTAMPRLLSLLASRTTSLLNFADLSRSISIPQSTLKRYMSLLETTFLIQTIPAWSGNLGKRLVKAPKVVLNDSGMVTQLLGLNEDQVVEDKGMLGPLLENFIVMELQKQSTWSTTKPHLYHFRTQTGQEVDIVLESASGKLVGIEVKASKTVTSRDFNGLRMMSENLGKRFHRGILLYSGDQAVPYGSDLYALPINTIWTFGGNNREA